MTDGILFELFTSMLANIIEMVPESGSINISFRDSQGKVSDEASITRDELMKHLDDISPEIPLPDNVVQLFGKKRSA